MFHPILVQIYIYGVYCHRDLNPDIIIFYYHTSWRYASNLLLWNTLLSPEHYCDIILLLFNWLTLLSLLMLTSGFNPYFFFINWIQVVKAQGVPSLAKIKKNGFARNMALFEWIITHQEAQPPIESKFFFLNLYNGSKSI